MYLLQCQGNFSRDFAPSDRALSITGQIEKKGKGSGPPPNIEGNGYIAYFQAYTNTYAPPERLAGAVYQEAALPSGYPRPFYRNQARLPWFYKEVLDILTEFNRIKPVWIELGLQTIHEKTADVLCRGYELPVFEASVRALRLRRIPW
ncbi:MAG: hypothetical protein V8S14_06005 [Lachnospiraceae bacterium]